MVFVYLFVVLVLNLIIMDWDDGSLSSCGDEEAFMAASIATTSVILNVEEEEEEALHAAKISGPLQCLPMSHKK